jgi:hypothetical protein
MFRVLGSMDPDIRVPYQIDWSRYFEAFNDTLSSAEVEVVNALGEVISSDLSVDFVQTSSGVVTFWLSGGTAGQRYTVRCSVVGANTTPIQTRDCLTVIVPVSQR